MSGPVVVIVFMLLSLSVLCGCGKPKSLHEAALAGDTEAVRVLLEHGADVNAQSEDEDVGNPHTLASCEIFDPATNQFQQATPLPHPVHEHQACPLLTGALITGGLLIAPEIHRVIRDAVIRGVD